MNYQMHFDPYLIGHLKERNEEMLKEVSTYRLEKRLRENREPYSGRLVAFISSGTLPLLRKAGLLAG